MLALATEDRYGAGTVLEVNDVGGWCEVQLLNDPGPQGYSKNPRLKAVETISSVVRALKEDAEGGKEQSSKW